MDASATMDLTLSASANTTLVNTAKNATAPAKRVDTTTTANGCVDLQGGLDVNAGADASFFSFFDKSTKISLFSKKFQLFKVI